MSGIGAVVAEPESDDLGCHPDLQEMHRGSVPECVGRNPAISQRWRYGAGFHDPLAQLPRNTGAAHLLTKAIR